MPFRAKHFLSKPACRPEFHSTLPPQVAVCAYANRQLWLWWRQFSERSLEGHTPPFARNRDLFQKYKTESCYWIRIFECARNCLQCFPLRRIRLGTSPSTTKRHSTGRNGPFKTNQGCWQNAMSLALVTCVGNGLAPFRSKKIIQRGLGTVRP